MTWATTNPPRCTMPIRFVDKYKVGFQVVVEADEGLLLGGRTVDSGPVFDRFFDALGHMNAVIDDNVTVERSVRLGVVPFRGMVSSGVLEPVATPRDYRQ